MEKMTRERFEQLPDHRGNGAGVPVAIEDGRMGLITHWDDDGAQIEAYRGNEHECLRVPWGNVIGTAVGLVIGLRGAVRDADGEPYVLNPKPLKAPRREMRDLVRSIAVEIDEDRQPVLAVGGGIPEEVVTRQERILKIEGEFPADAIDTVEINGYRFVRVRP